MQESIVFSLWSISIQIGIHRVGSQTVEDPFILGFLVQFE